MHFVPAAFRQRFHQPYYFDPRLQCVVTGDEANVAAADDEQLLRRAQQVAVDQRLERACAVDSGERVAAEGEEPLARAAGDKDHLGRDQDIFFAILQNPYFFIAEHRQGGRVSPHFHGFTLANFVLQARGNVDPACASIHRI